MKACNFCVRSKVNDDDSGKMEADEFFKMMMSKGDGTLVCLVCQGKGHKDEKLAIDAPWPHNAMPFSHVREYTGGEQLQTLIVSENLLRAQGVDDLVQMMIQAKWVLNFAAFLYVHARVNVFMFVCA